METKHLNLMPFAQALEIMESLHAAVAADPQHPGVILVVQHPPTVTMGKRERTQDMLVPPDQLKFKGIAYHQIDRGGSVTVHEPGQVVIYPIIPLEKYGLTVRSYVCALEQSMIDTCAHFHVKANRDPINPGVWVKQNKIGAVGIRVLNRVTKHGIAFNVNNSLETFQTIVPCGLHGRGVTNLYQEILANRNQEEKEEKFELKLDLDVRDVEKFLADQVKSKIVAKIII